MSAAKPSFGQRLSLVLAERGPLCLGIDPHPQLLAGWNLPDTASGAAAFGLKAVAAAAQARIGVVKPQIAFFERFGADGFAALEEVLAAARELIPLTIADAKRGDIGSTLIGYLAAWLESGAPLHADALTLSPYLGWDTVTPALQWAADQRAGIFVLAATSNPGAQLVQGAISRAAQMETGETVAGNIFSRIKAYNRSPGMTAAVIPQAASSKVADFLKGHPVGNQGVVVGATADFSALNWAKLAVNAAPGEILTPVLAPGFGFQGAEPQLLPTLARSLGPHIFSTLFSESRSLLARPVEALAEAMATRQEEYRSALENLLPLPSEGHGNNKCTASDHEVFDAESWDFLERFSSRLTVLAGPTAVGKGTVLGCLLEEDPQAQVSISATTRAPREQEQDGVHYFFWNAETFDRQLAAGQMLEWAWVHRERYGTPWGPLLAQLRAGKKVILEIDVQGANQVRQRLPRVRTVMLLPPSWEALEERLLMRGTEDAELRSRRLETARAELMRRHEFSHLLVNKDYRRAAAELQQIMKLPG